MLLMAIQSLRIRRVWPACDSKWVSLLGWLLGCLAKAIWSIGSQLVTTEQPRRIDGFRQTHRDCMVPFDILAHWRFKNHSLGMMALGWEWHRLKTIPIGCANTTWWQQRRHFWWAPPSYSMHKSLAIFVRAYTHPLPFSPPTSNLSAYHARRICPARLYDGVRIDSVAWMQKNGWDAEHRSKTARKGPCATRKGNQGNWPHLYPCLKTKCRLLTPLDLLIFSHNVITSFACQWSRWRVTLRSGLGWK